MTDANSLLVIASPSDSLRIRWSEILEAHPQCALKDRAAMKRFLENDLSRRTSVLVCDVTLIERGRDRLLTQLSRTAGNAPVLVMTTGSAEQIDLEWLNCGVRGSCPQAVEEDVLRETVASLLAGETWFSRRLVASIINRFSSATVDEVEPKTGEWDEPVSKLTAREREVAKLVTEGLNNKLIARQLDVCERTVKAHLTTIFLKLGIEGRVLLALSLKNRL